MNNSDSIFKIGDYLCSIYDRRFIIQIKDIKSIFNHSYYRKLLYQYDIIQYPDGRQVENLEILPEQFFELPEDSIVNSFRLDESYKLKSLIDYL